MRGLSKAEVLRAIAAIDGPRPIIFAGSPHVELAADGSGGTPLSTPIGHRENGHVHGLSLSQRSGPSSPASPPREQSPRARRSLLSVVANRPLPPPTVPSATSSERVPSDTPPLDPVDAAIQLYACAHESEGKRFVEVHVLPCFV